MHNSFVSLKNCNKLFPLLAALFIFSTTGYSTTIEVVSEEVPNYELRVYYYVTGNLTHAKSQMATGKAGEGYFYNYVQVNYSSTSEIKSSDCCNGEGQPGKIWKYDDIKFTTKSTAQDIFVPEWINRITCNSANQEWHRYWHDIFNHEYRHYTDYKSLIEDPKKYKDVVEGLSLETSCTNQTEEEAVAELGKSATDACQLIAGEIGDQYDILESTFHREGGLPNKFPPIRLSEECQ